MKQASDSHYWNLIQLMHFPFTDTAASFACISLTMAGWRVSSVLVKHHWPLQGPEVSNMKVVFFFKSA